jgi:hypothetical protein
VKSSAKAMGLMIEIMLSTLFFAMVCLVVLQVFLEAQRLGQYSRDKSGAVALAQSVGDMFRSQQSGSKEGLEGMLSGCYESALLKEGESRYIICLDETMAPSGEKGSNCFAAIDIMDVKNTPAGTLRRALIQVEKQGVVLFELAVDRYISRT